MQNYNTSKNDLFSRYKLNYHTLSLYICATYDKEVTQSLDFEAVRDSLSDGQTASKLWVIEEVGRFLDIKDKSVCIFGGWVGLLGRFFFDYLKSKQVANVEIDGTLRKVNSYLMAGYEDRFEFIHSDMYEFDYASKDFDIYVNTSGEHIESLKEWIEMIPEGKIVCIQSNDYFSHPQHINCVNTAMELTEKVLEAKNVKNVIYTGTLPLPIYNRFMTIALT